MEKRCKFDVRIVCHQETCDWIDFQGNVKICKHFLGGSNYFMRRRKKVSPLVRGVS